MIEDPAAHDVQRGPSEAGGGDASPPPRPVADSPLPPAKPISCPESEPSEEHWCPKALAVCRYTDDCSQRPSTVPPERSYECRSSRWTRISSRYPVLCPSAMPAMGEPCETTCELPACEYSTPCGTASAVCDLRTGTWQVSGLCPGADAGAVADASVEPP